MKKTILILALALFAAPPVNACVGKVLSVGVLDSAEGHILSELLSNLINERTGTSVKVTYYTNERELDEAVKIGKVDILIENTTRALRDLNMPPEQDPDKAYSAVKTAYEKERGLVWLKPFRFVHAGGGGPAYTSTVLRLEIINNFPALPRVIGKLGPAVTDEAYGKLIRSVDAGETPKKAARDFLRSKKLI